MSQRLGKNHGGYRGEQIDIQSILEEVKSATEEKNWRRDAFTIPGGTELLAYRRTGRRARRRLYLSTGIHGDEPAGPCAVLRLLQEDRWPDHLDVWLCPCLNLTGFPLNTRESAAGIDLNRDYRHRNTAEVRTHVAWLKQQPEFDLAVCLHEDWEANGFYLYEQNPDLRPALGEKIIAKVSQVCPIETGETVDGWAVSKGIVRPEIHPDERPQWPEALFLISYKTRQTYTLESPSDFPLPTRIEAHVVAIRTLMEHM